MSASPAVNFWQHFLRLERQAGAFHKESSECGKQETGNSFLPNLLLWLPLASPFLPLLFLGLTHLPLLTLPSLVSHFLRQFWFCFIRDTSSGPLCSVTGPGPSHKGRPSAWPWCSPSWTCCAGDIIYPTQWYTRGCDDQHSVIISTQLGGSLLRLLTVLLAKEEPGQL